MKKGSRQIDAGSFLLGYWKANPEATLADVCKALKEEREARGFNWPQTKPKLVMPLPVTFRAPDASRSQ